MKEHNSRIISIEERVYNTIKAGSMIDFGDRLLLSVSAGKDSMACLFILMALKKALDCSFVLFHLNHCVRGQESDADEAFLLNLGDSLDIPIIVHHHDFTIDKPHGVSFEEHARSIRYELLEKTAAEFRCHRIVTAHTASDSVETLIMRIFSGTGVRGLMGIPQKRNNIIRPIIGLSSREVIQYCRDRGIKWREDSTNLDPVYKRNLVRHKIFPFIEDYFPEAFGALLQLSSNAAESVKLVDELIMTAYPSAYRLVENGVRIDYGAISDNPFLLKYLLNQAVSELGSGFLKVALFNEIIKRLSHRKSHMVLYQNQKVKIKLTRENNEPVIIVTGHDIHEEDIICEEWSCPVDIKAEPGESSTIRIDNIRFILQVVSREDWIKLREKRDFFWVSIPENFEKAEIRNRRKGDRFKTETGTKKIKDLFIEKKLDRVMKNRVPFLIINNEIALIMGGIVCDELNVRVSRDFMIKDSTKKMLAIYTEDAATSDVRPDNQ